MGMSLILLISASRSSMVSFTTDLARLCCLRNVYITTTAFRPLRFFLPSIVTAFALVLPPLSPLGHLTSHLFYGSLETRTELR